MDSDVEESYGEKSFNSAAVPPPKLDEDFIKELEQLIWDVGARGEFEVGRFGYLSVGFSSIPLSFLFIYPTAAGGFPPPRG